MYQHIPLGGHKRTAIQNTQIHSMSTNKHILLLPGANAPLWTCMLTSVLKHTPFPTSTSRNARSLGINNPLQPFNPQLSTLFPWFAVTGRLKIWGRRRRGGHRVSVRSRQMLLNPTEALLAFCSQQSRAASVPAAVPPGHQCNQAEQGNNHQPFSWNNIIVYRKIQEKTFNSYLFPKPNQWSSPHKGVLCDEYHITTAWSCILQN